MCVCVWLARREGKARDSGKLIFSVCVCVCVHARAPGWLGGKGRLGTVGN